MPLRRFLRFVSLAVLALVAIHATRGAAIASGEDTAKELDFSDAVQQKVHAIEARSGMVGPAMSAGEAEKSDADSQAIREILEVSGGVRKTKETTAELDAQVQQIVLEEAQALGIESVPEVKEATAPELPVPPDVLALSGQVQLGYEKDAFTSVDSGTATTISYFESYQFLLDTQPAAKTHLLFNENLYRSNIRQANTIGGTFEDILDRHWSGKLITTLDREEFKPNQSTTDFVDQDVQGVIDLHLPDDLVAEQSITRERKDFDVESSINSSYKLVIEEWSIEKQVGGGDVKLDLQVTGQNFDTTPTSNFLRTDQTFRYAAPINRKLDVEYDLVREKENLNSVPAVSGDYVDNLNRLQLNAQFSPVQGLGVTTEYEGRTYDVPDAIYLSYHRFLINPMYTLNQTEHTNYLLGYSQEIWDYEDFDPTIVVATDQNYRDSKWMGTFNFQKRKLLVNANLALGGRHYPNFQSDTQSDYSTVDSSITTQYNFTSRFQGTFALSRSLQSYTLEPTASSRTTMVALTFSMRL